MGIMTCIGSIKAVGMGISGEPTMEDEEWQGPQAYFRAAI